MNIYYYSSPIGNLKIISEGEFITNVSLTGDEVCQATNKLSPPITAVVEWLDGYFSGLKPSLCPPIKLSGSEFAKRVWEEVKLIPYGKTKTYGEISEIMTKKYGKNCSPRAVGGAVGRNPVAIIIPCHRVVGSGGKLGGYAYGEKAKRFLLGLEGKVELKG